MSGELRKPRPLMSPRHQLARLRCLRPDWLESSILRPLNTSILSQSAGRSLHGRETCRGWSDSYRAISAPAPVVSPSRSAGLKHERHAAPGAIRVTPPSTQDAMTSNLGCSTSGRVWLTRTSAVSRSWKPSRTSYARGLPPNIVRQLSNFSILTKLPGSLSPCSTGQFGGSMFYLAGMKHDMGEQPVWSTP
jgi:hypothetical protein